MFQRGNKIKDIDHIDQRYNDILKEIYEEINQIIKGKREIMYSDIINLVIRKQCEGDIYNQIIIWCNYNIKQGKYLVNISKP